MGNNASAAMLGIGTCKLELREGRTLYLHDVLYAPEGRRNLVSVLVLRELVFSIMFENGYVKILLDNVYYGPSNIYVSSCLMLAEIVPVWTVDLTTTDHVARD